VTIGTLFARAFLVFQSIRQEPREQMHASLHVVVGHGADQDIYVSGPTFVIGRASDCNLRLNSPWISHHHCELTLREECLVIRNMDGKYHTSVNGECVKGERKLKSGDRIGVGRNLFEVRLAKKG
jgi:pSer/pThr/pTyr-binding forkhead associated (FHA) protein